MQQTHEPSQDSAAPHKDRAIATKIAGNTLKLLPALIKQPINLALRQQQLARPKTRAAVPEALKRPSSKKAPKPNTEAPVPMDYSKVMQEFKDAARVTLYEHHPKATKKCVDQAVNRAWLESSERELALSVMSESEKKKRRFLPPAKSS